MSVQLWSSSGRATEGQAPLISAEAVLCDMDGTLVDSSARGVDVGLFRPRPRHE